MRRPLPLLLWRRGPGRGGTLRERRSRSRPPSLIRSAGRGRAVCLCTSMLTGHRTVSLSSFGGEGRGEEALYARTTQPLMAALSIQLRRSREASCPASAPTPRLAAERNDCFPPSSSPAGSRCAAAVRARSPTKHPLDCCATDNSKSAVPQFPRLSGIDLVLRHVPAVGATRVQSRPVP